MQLEQELYFGKHSSDQFWTIQKKLFWGKIKHHYQN